MGYQDFILLISEGIVKVVSGNVLCKEVKCVCVCGAGEFSRILYFISFPEYVPEYVIYEYEETMRRL